MDESPEHLGVREEEVYALSLIYDNLVIKEDAISGVLFIPVEMDGYLCVDRGEEDSRHVRFLPEVSIYFSTSPGYPELQGPKIRLKCSWLSEEQLKDTERELRTIWEVSRELCLYNMIDELTERTKSVFGLRSLDVSQQVFDEIRVFSDNEESKRFVSGVYFCEICLENKKGVDCFRLPVCHHIFCKVLSPSKVSLLTDLAMS